MSDSTQELMGMFGTCVYCGEPIMVQDERVCVDGAFQWAHAECKRDDEAMYEQGEA